MDIGEAISRLHRNGIQVEVLASTPKLLIAISLGGAQTPERRALRGRRQPLSTLRPAEPHRCAGTIGEACHWKQGVTSDNMIITFHKEES